MKGIEILFRGEKIKIDSGCVFLNNRNGHYFIQASGLDGDNALKWIESEMDLGEVLDIEFKNIDNVSKPIVEKAFSNSIPMTDKETGEMLDEKLIYFYALEKLLKEEGLL